MTRGELALALPLRAPKVIDAQLGRVREAEAAAGVDLGTAHDDAHELVVHPLPLHGAEWAACLLELLPQRPAEVLRVEFDRRGVCWEPDKRNRAVIARLAAAAGRAPWSLARLVLDHPPEEVIGLIVSADEERVRLLTHGGLRELEAHRVRYSSSIVALRPKQDNAPDEAPIEGRSTMPKHHDLAEQVKEQLDVDDEVTLIEGKSYTIVKVGGVTVASVRSGGAKVTVRNTDPAALARSIEAAV